jgi:hypothetical protein
MKYNEIANVYFDMLNDKLDEQILSEQIELTAEDFKFLQEAGGQTHVQTNQPNPPTSYKDHVHNVANHMTDKQTGDVDAAAFRKAKDGLKKASMEKGIKYSRALHVARAISNGVHLGGGYEQVGRTKGK